jgi:hypothetical protein
MDFAEILRKLVLAVGASGEISVDAFKGFVTADLGAEELERLIDALNARGIWIVEE